MSKQSKKNNKKSSKSIKSEIDKFLDNKDYDMALKKCDEFINNHPKNIYGYTKKINILTDGYSKYLCPEKFKEVKKLHENELMLATKNTISNIKRDFDEYEIDIREKEELEKTRKELTLNYLMLMVYKNKEEFINNILIKIKNYKPNGKRIQNVYDLINGLFLVSLLIFNLFNINLLLILTIPFGVYGLIIIYNFFDTNLNKENISKNDYNVYNNIIKSCKIKKEELEEEIKKVSETIEFNKNKKLGSISRMPEKFKDSLEYLYNNDEEKLANEINNLYISEKNDKFKEKLEENTNASYEEIISKIEDFSKEYDNKTNLFIESAINKKKSNNAKFIVMKQIKTWNVVLVIILLILSILSFIVLINNFYDMNLKSFIVSVIIGLISMLSYNINRGKSGNIIDTFNDNLLSTIFNASLTYNLIYSSITNDLNFVYCFIEVPIIFILIFIGFVMLISFVKYVNLLRKLRK